jgi:hypothetical protein
MSALLAHEPEPRLSGYEIGILLVADQFGNRVERGQYPRDLPRLEDLGLGYFGRNNPDRWFLTDRGREIARSYK